ncbi:MAG: hypothetical protein GWM90_12080 [Gemmatimonadetes bacterium]|nr:glycerate kinase [Gemmatimonadota bacterium]NIQ54741.1 glycerate kinase [Gemmatimonadota bacterium]NIU74953.1 hypothetical protein [Gammaproteobacteria bacterium]NIX44826.1 hypothetical protein [Gemmatimonadota bacterium]NIY09064.1 hypothetical protein [Gemmatimonadota bacterium]
MGKVTGEVVARAAARGVPTLLVAGSAACGAPPGVSVVTGDGAVLDADGVAALVADALPGLLARRRRR